MSAIGRSSDTSAGIDLTSAFLFDLDGTLYTSEGVIPGAVDAVATLRSRGVPLRFVTNTTRTSRRAVADRLAAFGFAVADEELFTPAIAAGTVLHERRIELISPFVARDLLDDLEGFSLCGGVSSQRCTARPGAVLVGDLGNDWTPLLLNEAFRYVMDGALLLALHKGRYWMGPQGLELDAGAYVAGLEYATGVQALLCGKPQVTFFDSVVLSLGLRRPFRDGERPVMIGDDLWNDIEGAQRAGLSAWLVRTGKFRADVLESSTITPDRVVDSVADVIQ